MTKIPNELEEAHRSLNCLDSINQDWRLVQEIKLARSSLLTYLDSGCESDFDAYVFDSLKFLEKALDNKRSSDMLRVYSHKSQMSLERVFNPPLRHLGRVSDEKTYSSAEEREVAHLFQRYGTLTWGEVSDLLDVSKSTARRRLEPFIDRGEVKKLPNKKGEKVELKWVL